MLLNIVDSVKNFLFSMGVFAPFIACLLIIIESILPMLPLCVFITINFIFFGKLGGFLISWLFTCIGCFISFYLIKKGFKTITYNEAKKSGKLLNKMVKKFKNIDTTALTIIIAIPFTPAFIVNIACGIVKMDDKKFITSILIAKIFMVYFWGFIGSSLLDSFKNPYILIKVAIMVFCAYLFSLVTKKFTKI